MNRSKLFGRDERPSRASDERMRDPLTAVALSVVPGLGQFYTGQTTKGFLFIDVAIVNFVLLWMMLFTQPIVALLQTISKEAHGRVNTDVLNAFGQMQIGHPASTALILVIAGFAAYAGRDAYDAAKDQKRRSLYWDSVLEIAEAASGSYLMHFAGIITCAVIAIFLLVPPPPQRQVTEFDFITDPLKPTPPPVKAETVAQTSHNTTLKKVSDHPVSVRQTHSEVSRPATHQEVKTTAASRPAAQPQPTSHSAPAPPHLTPAVKPLLAMAPPTLPALPSGPRVTQMRAPVPVPTPLSLHEAAIRPAAAPAPQPMPSQATTGLPLLPSATAIATVGTAAGLRLPHALPSSGSPSSGQAQPGPISMPTAIGNGISPVPASAPSTGKGPGHAISTGDMPGPSKSLRPFGANGPTLTLARPDLGGQPGTKSDAREPNGKDNDGREGPTTKTIEVDFTQYMANLQRRIKSHWTPPRFPTSNQVKVTFRVSMTGELSDLRLDRTSGDPVVDRAALQAIRESAPFPNLPAGADKTEVIENGKVAIQFTFDYNVFGGGRGRVVGY